MKKAFTIMILLAGAMSGHSQGNVEFNDLTTNFKQMFFGVQPSANDNTTVTYNGYTVHEEMGSTSAPDETPKGATVYATGTALLGTGFSAQLLGAAGANDSLSQLAPIPGVFTSGILTFVTVAAGAGFLKGADLDAIPGTPAASPAATVAIAVWDDEGGTVTSLAMAQADGDPWEISNLGNVTTTIPPFVPASMPITIESFSLGTVPDQLSPAIALGVISASVFSFRRLK